MSILTKLIRIGNSRGILFPKTVLEKSGIQGSVQITVKGKVIIIKQANQGKKRNWSDFKKSKKEKADFIVNSFDSKDWTW